METVLNLILVLLTLLDVFLLPGYGLARRFFKTSDLVELFALSLGIGLFCGSILYFTLSAFLHIWLTPALIFGAANVVNLIHLPVFIRDVKALRRTGNLTDPLEPRPKNRNRTLLAVALVVFVLFTVRYNREEFALTCINYPVAYVSGIPMGDGSVANPERNDILTLEMEEREGNVAVIAATPALFEFLGYRLFYALEYLLLFLFAFLLGEQYLKRFGAGIVLAVLLTFTPYLASIQELDQNVNALTASVIMFHLLLGREKRFFWAGLFFGIAFGCRHILLAGGSASSSTP